MWHLPASLRILLRSRSVNVLSVLAPGRVAFFPGLFAHLVVLSTGLCVTIHVPSGVLTELQVLMPSGPLNVVVPPPGGMEKQ